jgi:hypothetical protein
MRFMGPSLTELGKKEVEGKVSYSEIYWEFVEAMAVRMNENKVKYGPHNYRKPLYDKSQLLDSALRHLLKVIEPKKGDTETKEQHLAAVSCNLMMFLYQENNF